jgi:phosphoribosylamine---glycine ligase
MNILLIDVYGCYLDFALRCKASGHDVRMFVGVGKDGHRSKIGDGMVERVAHWEGSMNWADIVLLSDNVKYIHALEGWRRRGYPIWGPNLETTEWELDRAKGQAVLAKAGIPVMPSIPFTSLDKAKQFVLANPKRWVSKPNADDNKALSYVSKSPADMVFMLDYWKKHSTLKGDFILQEFTPGIEVAVGGWFGREGFSRWFLENFEHKKLMNDDVGVNTGEMGTVMKYTEESELAEILLKPLEGELYRQGYTGYIDVSVIVSEKGDPMPLEFTMRPGWPLFQIQSSLHRGDPVQWMFDALDGRDTLEVYEDVATGIIMAIPDFPYSRLTKKEVSGYPIYGWDKIPSRNFHPAEVMCGEIPVNEGGKVKYAEGYVTAGDYVCVVSGNAKTVSDSRDRAYANLKRIEIPNSPMWRTDIGCRLEEQLPKLQKHGFCTDWKW